jgi:hypothetical protein
MNPKANRIQTQGSMDAQSTKPYARKVLACFYAQINQKVDHAMINFHYKTTIIVDHFVDHLLVDMHVLF